MAQLYKGERDASTVAVPLELKERIEAAAVRHGYKRPGVYLNDLISGLHPDHRQQPEFAESIGSLIPLLLPRTPEWTSSNRHVFAIRTPVGVKSRIKSAYESLGYSQRTAYLVALMSALHPAAPGDDRESIMRDAPMLAPEAAHSLVDVVLDGSVDIPFPSAAKSGPEQQTLLDRYELEHPQQTAA
ncbi:hypothetical protein B0I32_15215 [Nonomuraea fuscirosea]|uniref:Uncharacterized protein n=1 Tax=Nonomuraea fuscirosea TaxID=1291556 RepID=A0A2T0LM57_9ACTN|nr:hypothetical protein [Nonomuraea fuscirosea]PRX44120.1 hypothetical protein B0I32_15215 [Nonomuraea fuscirosea]